MDMDMGSCFSICFCQWMDHVGCFHYIWLLFLICLTLNWN